MCYIVGPEIAASVQRIFAAAEAPIAWEAVDVTPVRNPDGTMGIPQVQARPKSKWHPMIKSNFFLNLNY